MGTPGITRSPHFAKSFQFSNFLTDSQTNQNTMFGWLTVIILIYQPPVIS